MLLAASCTNEPVTNTSSSASPNSSLTAHSPEQASLRTQNTVALAQGTQEEAFEFVAPDPRTHSFQVNVLFPANADIALTFVTPEEARLEILDDTIAAEQCSSEGGKTLCHMEFPALEAWTAGTWTAQVTKQSPESASVVVTIEWRNLER
jgi:hypothetical protein